MQTTLRTLVASSLALIGTFGLVKAQNCPPGETCELQAPEQQIVTIPQVQVSMLDDSAFFTRFNTMGGTRQLLSVRVTTAASIEVTAVATNNSADNVVFTVSSNPLLRVQDRVNQGGVGHVFDLDPVAPGNAVDINFSFNTDNQLGPNEGDTFVETANAGYNKGEGCPKVPLLWKLPDPMGTPPRDMTLVGMEKFVLP